MQGKIITVPAIETFGVIRDNDGGSYSFTIEDWKSPSEFLVDMPVNFEANGGQASQIYVISKITTDSSDVLIADQSAPVEKSRWKTVFFVGIALLTLFVSGVALYKTSSWSYSAKDLKSRYYASRIAKIRAKPSKDSKELGQLARGDIIDGSLVDGLSVSSKWIRIEGGPNAGGYVSVVNLSESRPVDVDMASGGSVSLSQDTDLHSMPNDNSSIVAHMLMGESVSVVGRTRDGWSEVTPKAGGVAYFKDGSAFSAVIALENPVNTGIAPETSSVASKELFTKLLEYQLQGRDDIFLGKIPSLIAVNSALYNTGDRDISHYVVMNMVNDGNRDSTTIDAKIALLVENGYLKYVPISGEYIEVCKKQWEYLACSGQYIFTAKAVSTISIEKANDFTIKLGHTEMVSVTDYTVPTEMFGRTVSEVKLLYKFVPNAMLDSQAGFDAFRFDLPYEYRKYGGGENVRAMMLLYGSGWKVENLRLGDISPVAQMGGTSVPIR